MSTKFKAMKKQKEMGAVFYLNGMYKAWLLGNWVQILAFEFDQF